MEPLYIRYHGEPIKVDPTGCKDVADLIEKAKKEFSPELDSFSLARLTLHLYSGTKLKGDMKISELLEPPFQNDWDSPLLIKYVYDISPIIKKPKISHPSEERKKRWEELNSILMQAEIDAEAESASEVGSTYSSLDWCHIAPIYDQILHLYTQPVKEVPQETMEVLHSYLSTLTRCMKTIIIASGPTWRHFIAPILVYVSDLFGPEDAVQIVVEGDLKGVNVKATGHFEFILKRKNKRVLIVEAKKDAMRWGMAQDIIGMEVASDLCGLDVVYGIVTNYVQWIFLKSHNDKIEKHLDVLLFDENEVAAVESLKRIAGKIYALLSDE